MTRYSLSNDGNYVEVLAFGTLALLVAARWTRRGAQGAPRLALAGGLLLGLAFWCHILAVIHLAASASSFWRPPRRDAAVARPRRWRSAGPWVICPGLLWNAANDWQSFHYLCRPGPRPAGARDRAGPGSRARRSRLFWRISCPVLLGYDPGYGPVVDAVLRGVALSPLGLVPGPSPAPWAAPARVRPAGRRCVAARSSRRSTSRWPSGAAQLPGNPRYLLFLMAPLAIVLAEACSGRVGRAGPRPPGGRGRLGSLGPAPGSRWPPDAKWRGLRADLQRGGRAPLLHRLLPGHQDQLRVRRAGDLLGQARPTTTEYFFEYRERVESAPAAALVAVNARPPRGWRRLADLGVAYERRDLMKPVLLPLAQGGPRGAVPRPRLPAALGKALTNSRSLPSLWSCGVIPCLREA